MITVADLPLGDIEALLGRYELELVCEPDGAAISGSFWGDKEAGIIGNKVFVRSDTPIHSLLHEACHTVCMTSERRDGLDTDAGGDDLEEAAVCYLQVILADHLDGVGRDRVMRDMDAWGYSFRLGSTARWFSDDAEDAFKWLIDKALVDGRGRPTFQLRH
jgi:hypothetical protein